MEFTIQDTFSTYGKVIAEKDGKKKHEIFMEELAKPYEGMFKAFGAPMKAPPGGYDALAAMKGWGFLLPEKLDDGTLETVDKFEKANALERCGRTMEDVLELFGDRADAGRAKHIRVGIFLLDGSKMDPKDRGYTGFGGIPGYIMLDYGEATDYNLARLETALAHEAHHNISGLAAGWDPMGITVGRYIVMEGLAEAFATTLYGEDLAGPWVADFDMADMPRLKAIMKPALGVKGFNAVRPYLFGDAKAGTSLGLPNAAGYIVGYHVVKAFMKRTGKSIIEATYTPAEQIIGESGFFD